LVWISFSVQAAIVGKTITYSVNDSKMMGYIAYDDAVKKQRPGILVVHDNWGLNQYIKTQADKLAKLGYIALAVDMLGDGQVATHPKLANVYGGKMLRKFEIAQANFLAARQLLAGQKYTDPKKIAAVGYGYGGAVVLEMVRRGVDLTAAVTVYGILKTHSPAVKPGQVKTKILICNGGADSAVKPEQIAALKSEMKNAKINYEFKSYQNAKHAFTDPGVTALGKKFKLPFEYNTKADQQSWQDIQAFLKRAF